MQRHLPLGCLGLQLSDRVGTKLDKAPKVALGEDVIRHEPRDLPGAQTCEQAKKKGPVKDPVLSFQQMSDVSTRETDLRIS